MKNNRKKVLIIVGSIVLLLGLIATFTYAYFTYGVSTNELTLDVTIADGLDITFTAEAPNEAGVTVDVDGAMMLSNGIGEVAGSGETQIDITLETSMDVMCFYDLYWVWDSGNSEDYVKTESDEKEFTISGVNQDISFADIQLPNYDDIELKLGEFDIIARGTTKTQNWNFTVNFYNINANQDAHADMVYNGKIEVRNANCVKAPTILSETAVGLAGGTEYTSSQDGTPYVIKRETVVGPASNATYTNVLNYETISMYSNSASPSTSGTTETGVFTKSSDNVWSNVPDNMTSGTYYHIVFPIQEEGYYEICYTLGMGSTSNSLSTYVTNNSNTNGGEQKVDISATTDTTTSACAYLGYLTTEKAIRVVNRAYTNIASVSFYLQKTNDEQAYDAGIRYEGLDPDNYVIFNGEEWRIIGFFEGSTIGLETGKQYTKIIKSESIGMIAWDCDDQNGDGDCIDDGEMENDWVNSTLNTYLNGEYLNGNGQITQNSFGEDIKSLELNAKNMIAQYNGDYSTWYLRGAYTSVHTTSEMYLIEKVTGAAGYRNGVLGDADVTTQSAIALMYPSDYGYAAYGDGCEVGTKLLHLFGGFKFPISGPSGLSGCASVDWLALSVGNWSLSPRLSKSSGSFVPSLLGDGGLQGDVLNAFKEVYPVLYLEANVQIVGGNGSQENPYRLS